MTTVTISVNGWGSGYLLPLPEECPICKKAISPKIMHSMRTCEMFGDNSQGLVAALGCPSCHGLFVAKYELDTTRNHLLNILELNPVRPVRKDFDPALSEISSNFIEIYNQALAAESYKLNQISGMGYRKALEFLIKDYAKKLDPGESESIEKEMLSKVIQKYIDHPKIRATAMASVWIGNDETHYIRKFEDKDVEDLKRLINSCVYWILADYDASDASAMISKKA